MRSNSAAETPAPRPEIQRLFEAAEKALESNRRVYDRMVGSALDARASGRIAAAVAWCEVAAHWALVHHPGEFGSRELEAILIEAARATAGSAEPATSHKDVRSVLHVFSWTYAAGGHTRLALRWISADPSRTHGLVLTSQPEFETPEAVQRSARELGIEIEYLASPFRGPFDRAARLRRLAARYDLVVLHTHPFDVVPSLAFAGDGPRPRTAVMIHSDHAFGLGVCAADLFIHFRDSTIPLSVARRGVELERCVLLPVPIASERHPDVPRAKIRAALGVPEDACVVMTMASAYKFHPVGPYNIRALLLEMLDALPDVHMLVVGPAPLREWSDLAGVSQGRIHVLGIRHDIDRLFSAADIYVDSFPANSMTAVLEAAAFGLPVLSLQPSELQNRHFVSDGPALDSLDWVARTPNEYVQRLRALVGSAEARRDAGATARHAVARYHEDGGWQAQLDALYARAATLDRRRGLPAVPEAPDRQVDLARVFMLAGFQGSAEEARAFELGLLLGVPLGDRLSALRAAGAELNRADARLLVGSRSRMLFHYVRHLQRRFRASP